MDIRVNGVAIAADAIHAEMQNHPAESPESAMEAAARALVVRTLLLQEADRLGIAAPADDPDGALPDDLRIARLIEQEVAMPEADEAACRRYYDSNRARFRSPDLFSARHILFAAAPDDAEARTAAKARAAEALRTLAEQPDRFPDLARTQSDCPSREQGGDLGQITRGSTVPEFETYLMSLDVGETCPVPVESRYGYHVVQLLERAEGRDLPFEQVHRRIADYLSDAVWRRAVHQYLLILAGRAQIEGIDLPAAASPLVQ